MGLESHLKKGHLWQVLIQHLFEELKKTEWCFTKAFCRVYRTLMLRTPKVKTSASNFCKIYLTTKLRNLLKTKENCRMSKVTKS